MQRLLRPAIGVVVLAWVAAALVMLAHNVKMNPQADTQMIAFSLQFLKSMGSGDVANALLAVRKYPLLPVAVLALLQGIAAALLFAAGAARSVADLTALAFLDPAAFVLTARLFVFGSAVATLLLTWRIAARLLPKGGYGAPLLLCSSILFLTFATSVRPHALVVAMVLLALFTALGLAERKGWKRELLAFAAAGLAFATLQSGFFSCIFPVWAYACRNGKIEWHRFLHPRLPLLILVAFLVSLITGYTFLLAPLFGHGTEIGFGLGNTDMNRQPWNGAGFSSLATLLIGSEPLILIAAIAGIVLILRDRRSAHPMLWGILLFIACFTVFFGSHGNSPPRFFLPLLPLLAILGARALQASRILAAAAVILSLAIGARLVMLGVQPDNYQRATAFIREHTRGPIASQIPPYYLDIPPARAGIREPTMERERFFKDLDHDLEGARVFIPQNDWRRATVFLGFEWSIPDAMKTSWTRCASFPFPGRSDNGFLWGEVDGAIVRLFLTRAFGPPLEVYCRDKTI